jgi:hypothetical protein
MFQPVIHQVADLGPVIGEDRYPDQKKNAAKQTRSDEPLTPGHVRQYLGDLIFH